MTDYKQIESILKSFPGYCIALSFHTKEENDRHDCVKEFFKGHEEGFFLRLCAGKNNPDYAYELYQKVGKSVSEIMGIFFEDIVKDKEKALELLKSEILRLRSENFKLKRQNIRKEVNN